MRGHCAPWRFQESSRISRLTQQHNARFLHQRQTGRQPLHFDLGKAEHLCFSALMAGCDTAGTHLPLAPLALQHDLFQGELTARRSRSLCNESAGSHGESVPEHFTHDRVATGDIAAFRCDTLHAGPHNNSSGDRFMLYALFAPNSYHEQQDQGYKQHYPCGHGDEWQLRSEAVYCRHAVFLWLSAHACL